MDGNGFSTDLVKAYAISDGHSRLRNGPFKVCSPGYCPAAALPLHTDEETLSRLGLKRYRALELKNSQSCVRSTRCRPLLFGENACRQDGSVRPWFSTSRSTASVAASSIAAQTVQDELVEDAAGHVDEQVSEAEILHGLFPLFHTFLPQAFALVLALLFFAGIHSTSEKRLQWLALIGFCDSQKMTGRYLQTFEPLFKEVLDRLRSMELALTCSSPEAKTKPFP